jgi:hypothetical protein
MGGVAGVPWTVDSLRSRPQTNPSGAADLNLKDYNLHL